MTYAYDTMHEAIFLRLSSKSEKTDVLLQRQQNKNYIVPTCNNIPHVWYNHPFIHTNLFKLNTLNSYGVKAKLEKQSSLHKKIH